MLQILVVALPNLFPTREITTKIAPSLGLILDLLEKGGKCLDFPMHLGL